MKKNINKQLIDNSYHALKSPLVGIKSLLFVIRRTPEILKNETIENKLQQVEDKTNLLHLRIETFLNFLQYKEQTVEFLYSFFSFQELMTSSIEEIQTKQKKSLIQYKSSDTHDIMADKDKLKEAISSILEKIIADSSENIIVASKKVGRNIILNIDYIIKVKENNQINKDEDHMQELKLYIAHQIILQHGGAIKGSTIENKLNIEIAIPTKARAK